LRCWASQSSGRQVRVSGDRQTNERRNGQTEGHRHHRVIAAGA